MPSSSAISLQSVAEAQLYHSAALGRQVGGYCLVDGLYSFLVGHVIGVWFGIECDQPPYAVARVHVAEPVQASVFHA